MPEIALSAPLAYPHTTTVPQTDVQHGVTVADPYRWLEGDVRTQKPVAEWVAAQNQVTQAYLATLPGRDALRARLTQLFDYERITLPEARGPRVFFRKNSGLQNQSVLMVQDGSGVPRPLIDPNLWAKDGATALAEWSASPDGKRVAYAVQDGGTDWRTIKVLDVDSGKILSDDLDWVKFSKIAWQYDNSGFFYSRNLATPGGKDFVSPVLDHSVYFHRIGTPQSADTLVYASPENRGYYNEAETSADGRWLVIRSSTGSDDSYEIRVKDLTDAGFEMFTLVSKRADDWRFVGNVGSGLYFVTNAGAPRYRVVAFDNITHAPREIVPESKDTITGAHILGNHVLVTSLHDASTAVRRYSLAGAPQGSVALPGIGTASGFEAGESPKDPTSYYTFTSYNAPTTIYRYNADTNSSSIFAAPKVAFNPADFTVEQRFFASKDGTKVPMFIAHKKGLDLSKGAPTLMYGYGGFNINVLPAFQVDALSW
ncbi:MAG: S9 family peptidase, partial [Sandarakinorhabdus sp.]|nr:S9 family peptidase [Sandarakinorhabdus sp.]